MFDGYGWGPSTDTADRWRDVRLGPQSKPCFQHGKMWSSNLPHALLMKLSCQNIYVISGSDPGGGGGTCGSGQHHVLLLVVNSYPDPLSEILYPPLVKMQFSYFVCCHIQCNLVAFSFISVECLF